jgi:hypothetical protein
MSDLLFDVPWWLPTLLGIIGISLAVSGNRRQNERTRAWGLGVIALAVSWALLSYLVDTDKEKCQKLTKQFVQSVVAQDWTTFDNSLDNKVSFRFAGSAWSIVGKDTLDQALRADIAHVGVQSARITAIDAHEDSGTITVHISVWSTQHSTMDQPLSSEWELDWHKPQTKFLLTQIRALRVSNLTSEDIKSSLPVR